MFPARCLRLPLVVSSTGVGGWAERAFRARGRRRSADGRLTVSVAVGSNIMVESVPPGGRPVDTVRLAAGVLAPAANGRSAHAGCGGPVLDVEVAHPGLVVEVVVRHVRVVGGGVITTRPTGSRREAGSAGCRCDAQ